MSGLKNEVVSWSLKNILISLLPFIVGTILRIVYTGQFTLDTLNPSELSFSMAILFIIVFQSINTLDDSNLRLSLSVIMQIGIFVSLTIFACSLLLKIHLETELQNQFNAFEEISQINPEKICELIQARKNDSFYSMLNRVNYFSIFMAIVSIPSVIYMKSRYKLN